MCGFVGYVGEFKTEDLKRAVQSIEHRGPDSEGFFVSENKNFALGFRRLAIQDLSDLGSQPMSSKTGDFHIVFNGEIYNVVELREELIDLGYKFKSTSDTEVVLNCFIEFGEEFVNHLNGIFAIAIYFSRFFSFSKASCCFCFCISISNS